MTQIDMMVMSRERLKYEELSPIPRGIEYVRIWRNNRYVYRWCTVHDLGRNMPGESFPEWESELADFPFWDEDENGKPKKKPGRPRGVLTSPRHRQIEEYLQKHGESTAQEIADHYGWPRTSATRTLNDNPHCISRLDPTVIKGRRFLWRLAE